MIATHEKAALAGAAYQSTYAIDSSTKLAAMIRVFLMLGKRGLNCFEAANRHHDYVLRTTVSDLQIRYGLTFERQREQVSNSFGALTACTRYWLAESSIPTAQALVGGGNE